MRVGGRDKGEGEERRREQGEKELTERRREEEMKEGRSGDRVWYYAVRHTTQHNSTVQYSTVQRTRTSYE